MITIKELGGRKFLLSSLLLIITFLLVMFGKVQAEDYLKIVLAVLAIFTGANTYLKKGENTTIQS